MMNPISEIISRIIEKLSNTNGYKKAWLEKYWIELVGKAAHKHSRPHKMDKVTLYVNVDSSAWNQALFIDKSNLIKKINQKFARPIVEEVKYQIGHFDISAVDQADADAILMSMKIIAEQEDASTVREITEIWNRRVLLSMINKKKKISRINR